MSISTSDIAWVAKLSRLQLSEDELETYGEQLKKIVDFIDLLQEADTDNTEPLAHPFPVQNVFREDELQESFSPDRALQNAPERRKDFFGVPAVLE